MRKRWLAALAAVLLLLASCGRAEKEAVPQDAYPETDAEPGVTVSRFKTFGLVNSAVYGKFEKPEEIRAFEDAVDTAERMPGILNVVFADYDVVIERDGVPQAIHLWIDQAAAEGSRGMYMDASDTGTGYRLTAEATKKLHDLIGGIRYSPEQSEQNGDVVIGADGKVRGDAWKRFADNVKGHAPDEVHITAYTVEGAPIFYDLRYDGESIEYRLDNTRDAFGSAAKEVEYCGGLEERPAERGTEYRLTACGADRNEPSKTFRLTIP
jgi:hypothetical protein